MVLEVKNTHRFTNGNNYAKILTNRCLVADVFKQDVQSLKELNAHVASAFLVHYLQEERQHVPLQKEAET